MLTITDNIVAMHGVLALLSLKRSLRVCRYQEVSNVRQKTTG